MDFTLLIMCVGLLIKRLNESWTPRLVLRWQGTPDKERHNMRLKHGLFLLQSTGT